MLLALTGCETVEQLDDRFREDTPYEEYAAALAAAGLAGTALTKDWLQAGHEAVTRPLAVTLPFQEDGFIAPEEPGAVGYRFTLERGRRLIVDVRLQSLEETRLFVDLFRVPADEDDPLRPVISTDSLPGTFSYEAWRDGAFILRIQPELLRGGTYTVTLRVEPQLAFPVEGRGVRAIQSRFGAPRDGGRRRHHGVDIFAPLGTPVLAAADGVATRVATTPIGGRVVWIRDRERNVSLYYAHLDRQAVRNGQRVQKGDTVGFVGNTGNARTTPPHLHFGLYRRREGPLDPYPFLAPAPARLPERIAAVEGLGRWVRVSDGGIRLRLGPSLKSPVLAELDRHTPVRVLGAAGAYYRVRLPDGTPGYVAARLTEPADRPVDSRTAEAPGAVLHRPVPGAPVVAQVPAGAELEVLGRFGPYLLVHVDGHRPGWLGAQPRP